MSSERIFRKLRLFVASPGDVGPHRDRVNQVATRLNRTGGVADQLQVMIEVVRWESHVAPLMGRPQAVIIEQVQAESWDIFVGILWLRFGSPTGARSDERAEDFASGTEEEFELAYSLWKATKKPRILFYRCLQPPEHLAHLDVQQFGKVKAFFDRFGPQGSTPGLYYTFVTWDDFEKKLEQDLSSILLSSKMLSEMAAAVPSEVSTNLADIYKPGQSYQVAFLSVDIVNHSQFVRKHRGSPEAVQSLMSSFYFMAGQIAAKHGGHVFSWAGDGGLLIFSGDRYRERAIFSGLQLQSEMTIFNIDTQKNPFAEPLSIRLAAHEGPLVYREPVGSISSAVLNFVVHLQQRATDPGEFNVTDSLIDNISPHIASRFAFKLRREGVPVYAYSLSTVDSLPSISSLERVEDELREKGRSLLRLADLAENLDGEGLENFSVAVECFYSLLQGFCTSLKVVDERWSIEYLAVVYRLGRAFASQEAQVWTRLRQAFNNLGTGADAELVAVIQTTSSRRSRPVLFLEKLCREVEERLSGKNSAVVGSLEGDVGEEDLVDRISRLLQADELDRQMLWTDILTNFKDALFEYLLSDPLDREALADELWRSADIVFHSEVMFFQRRRFERRLTELLSEGSMIDPRFAAVRFLLGVEAIKSTDEIVLHMQQFGACPTRGDVEIVWKCLAISHGDAATQRRAAEELDLQSIWQLVARPRIPVSVLAAIGRRLKEREGSELQKVFFDASRSNILEEIRCAKDKQAIARLTRIVLLLSEFEFMVETAYFERFDELLSRFLEAVRNVDLRVEYFEKIKRQIDSTRKQLGYPSGTIPKNIRELPLGIQRRLAGEAVYLTWFVRHPDSRIALETLRHLSLGNVERVLRMPEVNGDLMREILGRAEFFARRSAVLLALVHPKCTVEFARAHIAQLRSGMGGGVKILRALAGNSGANPSVRALARKIL
jgi:class 3 adenylate cyclase